MPELSSIFSGGKQTISGHQARLEDDIIEATLIVREFDVTMW